MARQAGRREILKWGLRAAAVALAGVGAGVLTDQAAAQKPSGGKRVVLISLDGFAASYLDDPKVPLPNLRQLVAEGARSKAMTVVTPSVTWPNHTTLVTGVTPGKHTVLANGKLEPSTGATPVVINPRRSKTELCRVPTFYDLAHQAGMTTAEINWPVTRGAPTLNWSFPDHPENVRYSTPSLVTELVEQKILTGPDDAAFRAVGSVTRDQIWTGAAAHLIRRHKPNVLLLHLLNTDGTQHAHGPQTNEAYTALALADSHVGQVLQALRETGLRESTNVLVVADHGFVRITQQIQPNARLRERGLIRPAANGETGAYEYDAQSISEGGAALVYVPRKLFQPELLAKTKAALEGLPGVERVYEAKDLPELGLGLHPRDPQLPDFVLAAKDGYAFGNDVTGAELVTPARPFGAHGFVHTNPKLDALFVAAGPGIKKGVKLERIRNVDVAPTAARLLGLTMRDVDGKVLEEILEPGS